MGRDSSIEDSTAPRNRYEFETSDPSVAQRFIRRIVAPHEPQFSTRPEPCRFRFTSITVDGFRIQSVECSLAGKVTMPPSGAVTVAHLLAGAVEFETDEGAVALTRGDSFLFQAHRPADIQWSDLRVGLVRLELSKVEQIAADIGGVESGLRFVAGHARSAAAAKYWQSAVRLVNREVLPNEFAANNPPIQRSVGSLLAVALLQTFPNTAMDEAPAGLVASDDRLPPAALRRAVDFIQAHAGEAITMDNIAAAARVTARSLQHGFRRTWNTTPTGYLRQVRLERAHRDLQAADATSGATVAAIAAKWGFGNVGRFAARYREVYGRPPHEVLRS